MKINLIKHLIIILCLASILIMPGCEVTEIDTEGNVGVANSIALDSTGNITGISYYDTTNNTLKFACGIFYNNKWEWYIETVETTGGAGYSTSIAFNGTNPHISYFDQGENALKYAVRINDTWETEIVDGSGRCGRDSSLVLDSDGNPRISYYDYGNGALKYAAKNEVWTISTISNTANAGKWSDIALDSNDNPVIAYTDVGSIKIVSNNGTAWSAPETIDSSSPVTGKISLGLDNADAPAVCYYRIADNSVVYAKKQSASWNKQQVAKSPQVIGFSSMALYNNLPRISYCTNKEIRIAVYNGSSWTYKSVDQSNIKDGDYFHTTSISVDGSDNIHVSFYDTRNRDLRCFIQ